MKFEDSAAGSLHSHGSTFGTPMPTPTAQGGAAAPATGNGSSGIGFAAPPAITLPKGGGAIRGIGEKLTANPVTWTESFTVPIPTSPGRSEFGPTLSLAYDSGHRNGAFRLGWCLRLPAVNCRTDKMLPLYRDTAESHAFLRSGEEDQVPVLDGEHGWARLGLDEPAYSPGYRVDRYRPRIEGLFARIERWTERADGQVHWRSLTRHNITTHFGPDASARIADPAEPTRVFGSLICQSHDTTWRWIRRHTRHTTAVPRGAAPPDVPATVALPAIPTAAQHHLYSTRVLTGISSSRRGGWSTW